MLAALIFMEKGSVGVDKLKEFNGGIGMLVLNNGKFVLLTRYVGYVPNSYNCD